MTFPAAAASAGVQPTFAASDMAGPVLLIEEDDLLRRALERHLATTYVAQAAPSVVSVLDRVAEGQFAAAVVGFPRPEGYGLRLVRRLAESNALLWRNTVLLVPPGLRRSTRQALHESGAVVLPRDTDTGAISSVLARLLSDLA